ncbi:MAG: hypothetical protein PWP03_722 [Candidatus Woesearchaeota archaeon]|nr:hypothetical protein [Candidatus Woesearchaeota archaeon]MDN5328084.1 hypothetical protein [Candidatus Woesearchaeota archaeon]
MTTFLKNQSFLALMKRYYLKDFSEEELTKIKHSLPNWLSLHIDYDNELSIMVEAFGKHNKTKFCNPVCKYCYTTQIPNSEKKKLINYAKDLYPHDILNNPELKEDILEAKEIAKKIGLPLRISTSGKGLTKEIAKFLEENSDIIEITLNSVNKKTRSEMMRIPEKQSEKEIQIISDLKKSNKVYLSSIISQDNFEEVSEILEFGKGYPKNILIPIAVTKWSSEKFLTKEQRRKVINLAGNYQNVVLAGTFFSELTEFLPLFLEGLDLNREIKHKTLLISSPSFGFVIEEIAKRLKQEFLEIKSSFGGNITSAGLLLGNDIIKALSKNPELLSRVEFVILPYISLNENKFIDGISLEKLSEKFNKPFIKGPKNYFELPEFLDEL